jgi:restriction system protein
MSKNQQLTRRQRRARVKLQEAGVGAIALGTLFVLAPAFVTNPIAHMVVAGLRTPGWLAIVVGIVLLGFYKVTARPEAGTAPQAPRASHVANPSPSSDRVDPSDAPIVDSAAARDYSAGKSASAPAEDAAPEIPTKWTAEVFDIIEWRRFEALCEGLFSQAGFETKTQSHGADGGVDIWLHSKNYPDGPVSVVQCKCWATKPVKVAEVRALLGSMTDKKVKRGIFATTSTFTHDAQQLAKDNSIQLLDRKALLDLITKRTPEQQVELLSVATKGKFWIPTCPSCGVKMTRRAPKSGGKRFWGCVNFPRCMTTING